MASSNPIAWLVKRAELNSKKCVLWNTLVLIMRAEVEGEQPEMSLLEQLADKYRDVEKAISVLQHILRMRKQIRDLPTPEQRRLCLDMFVSEDYDKIQAQMKGARVTKQLIVDQDDEKGIFTMRGRFGYSA